MIANPSSYGDLYSPGQIFVGRKVRFILEALARCGGFFFPKLASYFLIKTVWWKQRNKTTWMIWYDRLVESSDNA